MSVKEVHLTGTPASVSKYVAEEKEAHRGRGGEEYTTGYYSQNNQVPSVWLGKGAAAQGLSGAVKSADLEKLLAGVTMDGTDISKRGNHDKERRMGSDWTFSAPKAASILGIEDPRIKEWMMEAAQEAIEEFYAKEMAYARKGKGGAVTEFSENVAAAGYLHEVARAADGTIDPQIHVHVVVPNMLQREDGAWVSLRADYGENNKKVYTLGDVQVAKLMRKMQEKGGYELEARLERDDQGREHLSFGAKGISKEAEDVFSGRKKQINEYLKNNGIDPKTATRKQKDAAALNTRAAKDKNVDSVNLKYEHRARAREAGVDLAGIREAADRRAAADHGKSGAGQQKQITGAGAVRSAIQHLSEREDVFSRADLLAEAVKAGAGAVDLKDIHRAIDDRTGGLVRAADLDRDGTGKVEQQFTTKTAVFREAEILARAKSGQGKAEALIAIGDQEQIQEVVPVTFTTQEKEDGKRSSNNGSNVERAVSGTQEVETLSGNGLRNLSERSLDAHEIGQNPGVLRGDAGAGGSRDHDLRRATDDQRIKEILQKQEEKQGFAFSQGQREAVALALTTDARHAGVVGSSGAGKTTSMKVIVEQYRAAGYEVIGVAPTAKAKRELESAGCDETVTLASALLKKRDPEDTAKRIYIVDEAGMVSSKDMDKFVRKVDSEQSARSFLVGDPYQIESVEAGTPFAQLLETKSIPHVKIDEVQRQRAAPELLKIAQAYARGDAATGAELVRPYITQVKVEKGQDKVSAIASVAADRYMQMTPEDRRSTYFITDTNKMRQEINERARAGLVKSGALGDKAVTITALDKLDLTAEAATRSEKYVPGKKDPDAQVIVEFNRDFTDRDTLVSAKKGTQWNVVDTRGGKLTLQKREKPEETLEVNPAKINVAAYTERKMELREGDQVFFRKNDKERGVINGTNGTVVLDEKGHAAVKTDTGEVVKIQQNKAEALDYSYATTAHMVQGGTNRRSVPAFVAGGSASANIAYVAFTRQTHELEVITDDADKLVKQVGKYTEKQSAMDAAKVQTTGSLEEIQNARREAGHELGSVGDLAQAREQEQEQQQAREQEQERQQEQEQERELADTDSRSF